MEVCGLYIWAGAAEGRTWRKTTARAARDQERKRGREGPNGPGRSQKEKLLGSHPPPLDSNSSSSLQSHSQVHTSASEDMLHTQKKLPEGKPRWGNIARRVQKGPDRGQTKKQKFGRWHRKRRTAHTRLQTKKRSITYTTVSPRVPSSFPFSPTSCYLQEDPTRSQPSTKMSKFLPNGQGQLLTTT